MIGNRRNNARNNFPKSISVSSSNFSLIFLLSTSIRSFPIFDCFSKIPKSRNGIPYKKQSIFHEFFLSYHGFALFVNFFDFLLFISAICSEIMNVPHSFLHSVQKMLPNHFIVFSFCWISNLQINSNIMTTFIVFIITHRNNIVNNIQRGNLFFVEIPQISFLRIHIF